MSAFDTVPGGWFLSINSYGTQIGSWHESQTYSGNDTIVSFKPLSEVLTGNTCERIEDILSGTVTPVRSIPYTIPTENVVISDAGTLTFPSFGTVTDVFI